MIVKNKIMITEFKLFESTYNDIDDEDIVIQCGYYIESQLTNTDYFDWEYEWDSYNNYIPVYHFFYDFYMDEDTLTDILNFFEKINGDVNVGEGLHSLSGNNIKKQTKITVTLPSDTIINFSKMYKAQNNYNL